MDPTTDPAVEPAPVTPAPPALAPEPLPALPAPAPAPNWAVAGQALAAVTGLFPKKPITPELADQAQQLMALAEKEIAKFCKFGPFDVFAFEKPDVDFEEMYAKLSPLTQAEVNDATEHLISPDLILAWRTAVDNSRAFLKGQWPVSIRQAPTGPEWTPPPPSKAGLATQALAVAEDPLSVLRAMNTGVVTPSAVAAFKACHPELYKRVSSALAWALKLAGQAHRRCPWKQEFQLRLFFQQKPRGSMTFGPPAPDAAPKPVHLDIKFDDMRTKGQAAP